MPSLKSQHVKNHFRRQEPKIISKRGGGIIISKRGGGIIIYKRGGGIIIYKENLVVTIPPKKNSEEVIL